jgi:hypothetical protein
MREFSRFLGRVRARRVGGTVGRRSPAPGSGGGARPGGEVARPGDTARSPASNNAAYPGNSGSAGGPSLGDAEISECPLRPAPRPRFPQPHWAPVATPTPLPPALPHPRRSLALVSMAAARGARVSNAYLRRLRETKSATNSSLKSLITHLEL